MPRATGLRVIDVDGEWLADLDAKVTGNATNPGVSASHSAVSTSDIPTFLLSHSVSNIGNGPSWLSSDGEGVLYVGYGNANQAKAYDISDPETAPTLLSASPVLGTSTACLEVLDGVLYVTDQNDLTLRALDVSDPENMVILDSLAYSSGSTGGGRFGISPDGTKMLIGGPEAGGNANKPVLVDISDPSNLAILGTGSATVGGLHRGVAWLTNRYVALASRDDHTVRIFDVDSGTPVQVDSITTVGEVTTPLEVTGTTLLVGCYGTGDLEFYDCSNPLDLQLLGSVEIGVGSEQIDIVDGRAYVGMRIASAVAVVDIADRELVGTFAPGPTTTTGVAFYDGFVYLTSSEDPQNGRLYRIAVEPTLQGTISTLVAQTSSVEAAKANLAGANTFTGTQTVSGSGGVVAPKVTVGSAEITSASSTTLRANVTLTLLALLLYTSGRVIGVKGTENDAEYSFSLNGAGRMDWSDGTNAADLRQDRTAAGVLSVGADDCYRTGRAATGSRPSAVTVQAGAMFYDTTLSKPIWSDGTVWRDAAGTAV